MAIRIPKIIDLKDIKEFHIEVLNDNLILALQNKKTIKTNPNKTQF